MTGKETPDDIELIRLSWARSEGRVTNAQWLATSVIVTGDTDDAFTTVEMLRNYASWMVREGVLPWASARQTGHVLAGLVQREGVKWDHERRVFSGGRLACG